ncbi:PTS glucitol/sorbitol transporter subunit IIA [Zophobihabitans entericus]|uniref:PTS glucitol/sorbitol transporter subunit IIA n=1 Tax=Zophobihabitans entericus TaxID=1635327 RepID=A0A6G9IB70_9GAMM|nr:PTS glucitol/sorbitol transporter subunit IIA [Zophobihabitans entericus]QIQ21072.1 PTS glucitol/sorbitol transporter subunit IIA [Zophobihabitans entericus]
MSKTIYQSTITTIGEFAADALADGMMITFREGAPADLADYCFIHTHSQLDGNLSNNQTIQLGDNQYTITAVGDVAEQNLRELGHVTIRFDGSSEAELPGTVHVKGEIPTDIVAGNSIKILAN